MKVLAFLSLFFSLNASAAPKVLPPASALDFWSSLKAKDRKLAEKLVAATKALEPVIFFQTHRHALKIRNFFKTAYRAENLPKTKAQLSASEFESLTTYAALFLSKKGPYDEYANQKFTAAIPAEKLLALWQLYSRDDGAEPVKLITDPNFEAHEYPDGGGNLYEHGIKAAEVAEAVKAGFQLLPNCHVVRAGNSFKCEVLAAVNENLDPEVRQALRAGAYLLQDAARYAQSEEQEKQLYALTAYFLEGRPSMAKSANLWLIEQGSSGTIKLLLDFIYSMYDANSKVAKLEATVLSVDQNFRSWSDGLSKHRQFFEDHFGFGEFTRKFPSGYNPGILFTRRFYRSGAGLSDPGMSIEDSKDGSPVTLNIIPTDFESQPEYAAAIRAFLILHEYNGHPSGLVDPEKYKDEDAYTAMGQEGMALEEMRANLVAISSFQWPEKLIEIGFAKSQPELLSLAEKWIEQYAKAVLAAPSYAWPHVRAGLFLINYWQEKGVLHDIPKLIEASAELLKLVQRLRATRAKTEVDLLFERYAPLKEPVLSATPCNDVIIQPIEITEETLLIQGDVNLLETIIPYL